jgi:signal transduction histidine kinase
MTALLSWLTPRTLRGRLSLIALTTATLLMVILTVAFNTVVRHHLQRQADDELRTRAAAVATTVDTSGAEVRIVETSNDRLLDTNVWIYAGRKLVEQPPPTAGPDSLTLAADGLAGGGGRRCVTVHEGGSVRLCSTPVAGRRSAELARLGMSLDALLDRIRAVLRHERQLTGELSHELRTPLSRIIAELDWWRSRPRSDAETKATHEVIAEAAQSMRTICDTLLSEARDGLPAGPGTAEVEPTLRRLAEHLAVPAHLTLSVGGENNEVTAGIQPALLERIVSPLLTNALRYARTHVGVTTSRAGGSIRIDITDDGPGVPQSFAEHLFQPGRRADPSDGHGGAGLGLPLARRLARSAGGEVSYDGGFEPGARFVVTLPAG